MSKLNAVYKKQGKWYLGWIEELPGVNTQGRTLVEVKSNLREALMLLIEANRELAKFGGGRVLRERLSLPA